MRSPPSPTLEGDLDAEDALRRIVATCRDDLIKARAAVLATGRANAVHQTRVALRRLRAALVMFRDVVSNTEMPVLADEARWLASECAPSRDLHVFLKESSTDSSGTISRIGAKLARDRLLRARSALGSDRYAAFDLKLGRLASTAPTPGSPALKAFGQAALEAQYARVRRRGRKFASLTAAKLHRLRIAVKKLRYAEGFLRPTFNSATARAFVQETAHLQDMLGVAHDRAVAPQMIADIAAAARPSDKARSPLKRLAKKLKSGAIGDNRRLRRTWKSFKKVEPFWRT